MPVDITLKCRTKTDYPALSFCNECSVSCSGNIASNSPGKRKEDNSRSSQFTLGGVKQLHGPSARKAPRHAFRLLLHLYKPSTPQPSSRQYSDRPIVHRFYSHDTTTTPASPPFKSPTRSLVQLTVVEWRHHTER
jgi:hypothetical protein